MNLQALHHIPKSHMAYSADQDTLHIRLTTAKGDFQKVILKAFDPYNWMPGTHPEDPWIFDETRALYIEMELEHSDDLKDYFFAQVTGIVSHRIRYGFTLYAPNGDSFFYGPHHIMATQEMEKLDYDGMMYFNFPYINPEDVFTPPSWVKGIVWYQIYPERYANGDPSLNPSGVLPWNSEKIVTNHHFFGGDLQGVIDHLDDLVDLGIGGIYFTPIFESPSSHKYDTTDYFKIDPSFGSNDDFKRLVDEAHKRNIKVMLDGVFNHCGYDHAFFKDVREKNEASPYFDCFYIKDTPVEHIPEDRARVSQLTHEEMMNLNYAAFAYASNMPKLNTSNPIMRQHILDVGTYWVREYDIDGWRLDVSNEVSHDFWRAFRKAVKEVKPDAYIIGENWDNSYPWLMGDQFDAVMNYELLNILWQFIGTNEKIVHHLNVRDFTYALGKYLVQYPKTVSQVMFNMVDSHDTDRVMTVVNGDVRKAKLIYLLQMIMPGSPSIFYGSEIGLEGSFESARACMVYDDSTASNPLYSYLKTLIELRKTNPLMSSDRIHWLLVDEKNNACIIEKILDDTSMHIAINNSDKHVILEHECLSAPIALEPFEGRIL